MMETSTFVSPFSGQVCAGQVLSIGHPLINLELFNDIQLLSLRQAATNGDSKLHAELVLALIHCFGMHVSEFVCRGVVGNNSECLSL